MKGTVSAYLLNIFKSRNLWNGNVNSAIGGGPVLIKLRMHKSGVQPVLMWKEGKIIPKG
jgi:hypothetical protein